MPTKQEKEAIERTPNLKPEIVYFNSHQRIHQFYIEAIYLFVNKDLRMISLWFVFVTTKPLWKNVQLQFFKSVTTHSVHVYVFIQTLTKKSDNNTTDILCVMHLKCMYTILTLVPFAFISVSLRKQIQKRFSKVSLFRDTTVSA